jgi:hypothetical protein
MTRAQIATQLLNEMAPKGEKLAYINNREAELLKRMGGAGVDINKTGIKSYFDPGSGRGSVSESLIKQLSVQVGLHLVVMAEAEVLLQKEILLL